MTDLKPLSPTPPDFEKWISFATHFQGTEILRLDQIAEIWQGESYEKSDITLGDPNKDEFSKNAVVVVRSADHRSQNTGFVLKDVLKAKLSTNAAATANKNRFLKNGDLLITAKGATGKIARYIDLDFDEVENMITSEGTVATDSHIVIRVKKEIRNTFRKLVFRRLLMSQPYQQLFRSLTTVGKTKALALADLAAIQIPIFPVDKALILDLLLENEPNASLDRIAEILNQEQISMEAKICFTRSVEWQKFSDLPSNFPNTKARALLTDLLHIHGDVFLKEKAESQDPFVIWLRHFLEAAKHLEEILKGAPSAEKVLTLQGWQTELQDSSKPFQLALNKFRTEAKRDFRYIRDEVFSICGGITNGMLALAKQSEQEVLAQVKDRVPLHPSSLREAAEKEAIAKRLSSLWDHSKGLALHGTELYVIPFFLSLTKEPEFRNALSHQSRSAFDSALASFSSQSEIHRRVVRWFELLRPRMQEREIWDLLSHTRDCVADLGASSSRELSREFLEQISQKNIKLSGEASLPKEVMRFMVQAAKISPASSVYIPYIPGFEFSDFLPESAEGRFQFRSEHDADIFALHELIMERRSVFRVSDPVTEWNPFGDGINSVIAAPPFGLKLRNHPEFRDADAHCIIESSRLIKDDGTAIICVTPNFLFRGGRVYEDRRELIQQNIIHTAIYLPAGLLERSGIRTVLLILRPPSAEPQPVILIDASECLQKLETSRRPILDMVMLQSLLESDEHPKKRSIPQAELKKNGYDLSPGRYLLQELEKIPENHSVYRLGDIIKRTAHFPQCQVGDKGVQISQRLFPASGNLDPVSFDEQDTVAYEKLGSQAGWRRVNRDTLILNSILMKDGLRACLFEHKGKDLFLRPDMLTFEVRTAIVDPQWLLLALNSDFARNQLQPLTLGSGIPRIRPELLMELKLAVPNQHDQQRTLVAYHKESLLKSRAKELGLEEHIQSIKKEFLDDLRLKKHSISQIANDIKSAIAVITDELEKKGSISAGQIISRRRSINFNEYLQGMSQKCSKLGDMIELLTEEKRFEPPAPLDLNKAMKKLLREYQGEDFKLTFGLDERSFVDQTTGRAIKPIIRIGENDFQSLCRNIIDNAKRHGFKGSFDGAHIMADALLIEGEQIIELAFMNNGAPFPKGMTLERFVIRGEKAGVGGNTGTGGYHIKSIMDHVGGRLDIPPTISDDYPVEIRLHFPLSHD
jgi:type I restriction-modification system DNA methylase subunit